MIAWVCAGYSHQIDHTDFAHFVTSRDDPLRKTFAHSAELSVQNGREAHKYLILSFSNSAVANPVKLERVS